MALTAVRRKNRRTDPADTRVLILQEATRLIARYGVEGLRVKDVADAVGIRPPSVYKHFADRDAIIGAVAESMDADLARFLRPEPALEPAAWLDVWARSFVWFCASRPAFVVLTLRDMASPGGLAPITAALGPPVEALRRPPLQDLDEEFRSVWARGIEQGVFRPVSLRSLTAVLVGATLGAIAWPYDDRPRREASATEILQMQDDLSAIVTALTKPPEP